MRPREHLFELIHSLTPSEKRYFKLYATGISGREDSVYLKLFNAIDAMEEYDEALIKKQFAGEKFVKQLWVTKNYLYEIILKCLTQVTRENSPSTHMYAGLMAAEILFDKGLHEQSYQVAAKIEEKAKAYENFTMRDQVTELQSRALVKNSDLEAIVRNADAQQDVLLKRLKEIRLKKIAFSIFRLVLAEPAAASARKSAILSLISELRKEKLRPGDSAIARYYYYSALTFYHSFLSNKKERIRCAQLVVDALESNPHIIELFPHHYAAAINNLCNAFQAIGDFGKAAERLKKLKAIYQTEHIALKKDAQFYALSCILNTELLLAVNHHDFTGLDALHQEVKQLFEEYGDSLNPENTIELQLNLSHALFLAGHLAGAQNHLRDIVNNASSKRNSSDTYLSARILLLMAHHDLGDHHFLDKQADALLKYLKRNKKLYPFDALLLRYLRQKNPSKKAALLARMNEEIKKHRLSKTDSLTLKHVDVAYWLRKK